jgi:YHS domain-containing protein
MHRRFQTFIAIIVLSLFAIPVIADETTGKRLVNIDRHGLAIKGYDPVAYFTQSKPVKGDKNITATYGGATYRFASTENKAAFDADPQKYEPQFGGYCGYGASVNKLFDIQPDLWSIVDGRLILQNGATAVERWSKDVAGNLKKADANWPGLVNKNGK